MDENHKMLADMSVSYAADHLKSYYHSYLNGEEQTALTEELFRLARVLRRATRGLEPAKKVRLLYEVLSKSLTYDSATYAPGEGRGRFSYIGGLRSGKCVCMGISELFTLLAGILDLKAETVIGCVCKEVGRGGLHAWNMVWLPENGTDVPYHLDLTWDLDKYAANGFRYYLKSDDYMREQKRLWLPERYPRCPVDCDPRQIPEIDSEAVRLLCGRLEKLRTTNKEEEKHAALS